MNLRNSQPAGGNMSAWANAVVAVISGGLAGGVASAMISARSQMRLRRRDDTAVVYAEALAGMEEALHKTRYLFENYAQSDLPDECAGEKEQRRVAELQRGAREVAAARAQSVSRALLYATDGVRKDILEHSCVFAQELPAELLAGGGDQTFVKLDGIHDRILDGMRQHVQMLERGWLGARLTRKRGAYNG